MSIEISCPAGHRLRVPEASLGKKIRCPRCEAVFVAETDPVVDAAEPDDEEIVVEPIRSKRKPRNQIELAEQEQPAAGILLSPMHLLLLGGMWLASVLLAGVLGGMFAGRGAPPAVAGNETALSETSAEASDGPNEPASATSTPGMEGIRTDFNALLSYLDKKQYRMFLHELIPDFATTMGNRAGNLDMLDDRLLQSVNEIRMHLESAAKNGVPTFNQDQSYAELHYVISESKTLENLSPPSVPPLVTTPKLKPKGFGSNLTNAIRTAAAELENQPEVFVQGMYPLADLARLEEGDNMARLLHRMNTVPTMKEAMSRDLKELVTAEAKLEQGGQVATYELPPLVPGDSPRTIKFQKVNDDWRFFDGAANYRAESHRRASLPSKPQVVPGTKGVITLIKRDGHWRLQGEPSLIVEGETGSNSSPSRRAPSSRSLFQ